MPVEFKDYYKSLGVSRDAPNDEIRKAFRKLARQYHPDVAKDKPEAENRFKEINEAYEVLSDAEKRKKYDTLGANWNRASGSRPPPGSPGGGFGAGAPGEGFEFHFGGTGFSDFFEQFFGAGSGFPGQDPFGGGRRRAARPRGGPGFAQRGHDMEGDILVTLNELLQGSVRSVSVRRVNPETGAEETQTFRVRIPTGVRQGQKIRVAGKGGDGVGGGGAGDLFLRVRFARHPDFEVRGTDLHLTSPLAPWEAVLGATISVPTLERPLTLRVPAGASPGQQLRVRGRGLPVSGGTRGDLYVTLTIQVPTEVDDEEKALWEKLSRTSRFKPRA